MVSLIICGYGGVGRALVKIMQIDREHLQKTYGFTPKIKAITELNGALVNKEGLDIDTLVGLKDITASPDWVEGKTTLDTIGELEADILVECAWAAKDGEPAISNIKAAMARKMHVTSSNRLNTY